MKLQLDNVMARLSLDSEQRTAMELRKKIANAIYKTGRRGLGGRGTLHEDVER